MVEVTNLTIPTHIPMWQRRSIITRCFILHTLSLLFDYHVGIFVIFFNASFVILNSALCSLAICIIAVFKVLLPSVELKAKATACANKVMWLWATVNAGILAVSNRVDWDVQGGEALKKTGGIC